MSDAERPGEEDQPLNEPFEEVTDLAYGEHAAATFEVEQPHPRTLVLRGTCPRCRHSMEFMISDEVVRRLRWFRPGTKESMPVKTTEEPMLCTCGADHPNRPEGYVGCGAYWNLEVSPE